MYWIEIEKKNEDIISWEWNFLEVSSIREWGGREFVSEFEFDLHVGWSDLGHNM